MHGPKCAQDQVGTFVRFCNNIRHACNFSVAEVPAFVVPVFKKGPTASVANYRPISLTSVLCKILLERILAPKIIDHLHANGLVCPEQHGFLKRRSACTNLLDSLTK